MNRRPFVPTCARRNAAATAAIAASLSLLVLSAAPVRASGFHVYEQGAKASGQAAAFVARADDASAVYYNPAAMTGLERPSLLLGGSAVFLGKTTLETAVAKFDMKNETVTPVHVYYAHPLSGGRFAAGIGVGNPFGLTTDWNAPDFDGRFSAVRTELRTFLYNGNLAMRVMPGLSVAGGVDYLAADLRDFSRRSALPGNPPPEVLGNLSGTGNELGWNAALHYKQPAWSVGVNYRSGFEVKLDGDLSFTDVPSGNAPSPPFPPGTPWAAFFAKNPATGSIGLPATAAAGVAYTGLPGWQFEFDGHWLGWSSFDSLRIDVANANAVVKDRTVYEEWENTLSWRLGAAWTPYAGHEVRAGGYIENSAIPNRFLRPSIPDADRTGVTVGYGYRTGAFSVDAYYLHIMLKDVTVAASDLDPREAVPVGTYTSTLDLAGVSLGWRF